jgi:medium-chain acyl-[acyl-carrier-protein] hydrolase
MLERSTATKRTGGNPWFTCSPGTQNPKLCLFMLPFAGGSAAAYRSWLGAFSEDVEVCPVELPGRLSRASEAPMLAVRALVEEVGPAIAAHASGRFVLMGYSFGALLAFEIARWLERHSQPLPDRLIVAACAAPSLRPSVGSPHLLPDDELIAGIDARYTPLPRAVLEDAATRASVLSMFRGDLECLASYPYGERRATSVPITAVGGTNDPLVAAAAIAAWRTHTATRFDLHMLDGGHFFLDTARDALVEIARDCLFAPQTS